MTKEDCQGHIQKRMGTNLRSYKNKAKGKVISDCGTVGGKGQFNNVAMVWYGMSIPLVTPTQNQSSAFSFELFSVFFLFFFNYLETIFRFEVGKAVEYKGKLVRLYLPGNFSSIETVRSLFHASENEKVVPPELIIVVCASELYCEKRALAKYSICCETELALKWLNLIW